MLFREHDRVPGCVAYVPLGRVHQEDAVQFRLETGGFKHDDITWRFLHELIDVSSQDPAATPGPFPSYNEDVHVLFFHALETRFGDLVGHNDPSRHAHTRFRYNPTQVVHPPSHLEHIKSVDGVDRKRRGDLENVHEGHLGTFDPPNECRELNEIGFRRVLDGHQDVILLLRGWNDRLEDRRCELHDALPLRP